jgi:hypothetical protein
MSNTKPAYHQESLIEMQFVCGFVIFIYANEPSKEIFYAGSINAILLVMLIEHVFSYFVAYFRAYDIRENGKIDLNGIKRAPKEK